MTDAGERVAVVTGAGSGIGRATAVRLARAGYRVVLVGRREGPLEETRGLLRGGGHAVMPCDIADGGRVASLVTRVREELGQLDLLVNNAGWSPMKPIGEMSADDVSAVLGVNTFGPMVLAIAALPMLLDAGDGCVVNVSSMASADPFPGLSVYGGAKAAMNTFTKGLANEYGASGLRAFCVAPGAVETPLLRSIIDEEALPRGATLDPDAVAEVIEGFARGSRAEGNGETVFLASP